MSNPTPSGVPQQGAPGGQDLYPLLLDIHREIGTISARLDSKDQKEQEQDARLDDLEDQQEAGMQGAAKRAGVIATLASVSTGILAYVLAQLGKIPSIG